MNNNEEDEDVVVKISRTKIREKPGVPSISFFNNKLNAMTDREFLDVINVLANGAEILSDEFKKRKKTK